ncbi:MAG: FkbM family methyltransferase [Gallionellaceae bacterium]|jgi:FkbM family methyltransferase|nr:FkbM family methyltransferase [Gallionellaceae bacterium]
MNKEFVTLYRPKRLQSFFHSQRKKLLRFLLKQLTKRNEYPQFWINPKDIISREIALNGYYEKELLYGMQALVKTNTSDQIALDVGANIGNHTIFFSKLFKQVIAFEPAEENCYLLKANLYLNSIKNVKLVEKGLGNESAVLPFFGEDSGNSGAHGFGFDIVDANSGVRSVREVEVVRGDDELETLGITDRVALLKVDIEGFEPLALAGLEKTIKKSEPLICWEAFSHPVANVTVELLRGYEYEYFYHMTTRATNNDLANKIINSMGKSTYLIPLTECPILDGMNVASTKPITGLSLR